MVVASCAGAGSDAPVGSSASGETTVSLDLSGHTPLPGEEAAGRLEASLQEAFVAELAKSGVTLSVEELAARVNSFVTAMEEELARAEVEMAGITGAGAPAAEASAEGATGVLLLAPPRGVGASSRSALSTESAEDTTTTIHKASLLVGLLSGWMVGLTHVGPGDVGPATIDLSGNPFLNAPASLVYTKQGSKATLLFKASLGAEPPSNVGIRMEWRVVVEFCPDDAGEAPVEFSSLTEYLFNKDGETVSGELRMDGTGLVTVGDDANVSDVDLDLKGSRATRTARDGTIQPGATFAEVTMQLGSAGSDAALGRLSSGATQADVEALAENMGDTVKVFLFMVVAMMQQGWSKGQCIELKPEMPATVGLGSQTPADVTVHHRYEEKTLELPITATLTAGAVSIDPEEATGDPATFTYTAPSESNQTATITFEIRSKRGADRKTVDVTTESQAVDVAFSGTIDYSIQGISLHGVVTIPRVTLLEYGGNDPELKGTWIGTGPVEITLTSQIPGCGTATGTQQGGQVTVIATPHDEDGTLMLSLFAEDMEGGDATMSCGSGGATVAGMGISIGAGLINLGKVDIPAMPGTYPFESSGVAAGMVQYEVKGVAVVTESESFPG